MSDSQLYYLFTFAFIFLMIGLWIGLQSRDRRTPHEREREAYWLDCMRMINDLREAEAWSVTLPCDNPDFGGPNNIIEVFGEWFMTTDQKYGKGWQWTSITFHGGSLLECLAAAVHRRNIERAPSIDR